MKRKKEQTRAFSRRLQWQLLAVFIATITILMAIVSLLSYRKSEKVIQEQSSKLMQQQFQQNENHIKRYTNEVENVMRLLIVQDTLQAYMRAGWRDKFQSVEQIWEIFDYVNTLLQSYDYLESVYFYGSDGTALGVTESRQMVTHGKDLTLPWYQLGIDSQLTGHQGEILWFGGYTERDFSLEKINELETTPPLLTAACSIWLNAKRYVSVVVNIRQDVIADIFVDPDETEGGQESYLIDETGRIIVHWDEERVGTIAEYSSGELEAEQEDYLMRDNIQINHYHLSDPGWTIVNEIPASELYGELASLKRWFIGLTVGGWLIAFALYTYSLQRLTAPLSQLRIAMERMEYGSLGEQLDESSRNELGVLGRQFDQMSQSIDHMVKQIREMEQEKATLEKEALQAQLNPHFLFNTLSNMRFMAKLGQTEPLEACFGALGRMLQPLYRSEGELWSLREELDYMSNYLVIMNARFGRELDMEFEIGEELMDFQVLKFILQPLVENAIEHGFARANGEGMILLGAKLEKEVMQLYVEDNGGGISEEAQEELNERLRKAENQKKLYKNHVGIVNVHRRLRVHFGETYGLRLESVPGEGTCVWLSMPLLLK